MALEPFDKPSGSGAISLDEWIALNGEITALTRSGIPLEWGLAETGRSLDGRLGRVVRALADRMRNGQSLSDAIEAEKDGLPSIYRAVVNAGMRSGRLTSALEKLAEIAVEHAETRRAIADALFYPMIVVLAGYALFLLLILYTIPTVKDTFLLFRMPIPAVVSWLVAAGRWARYWAPWPPLFVILTTFGMIASTRSTVFDDRRSSGIFGFLRRFGMRTLLDHTRTSIFADLLALLIEHHVPFPEAIELAAEASGSNRLVAAAAKGAKACREGEPWERAIRLENAFPAIFDWLVASASGEREIVTALRLAAEDERDRAERAASMIKIYLPMFVTIAVGGAATSLYVLSLFVPFRALLDELSIPL